MGGESSLLQLDVGLLSVLALVAVAAGVVTLAVRQARWFVLGSCLFACTLGMPLEDEYRSRFHPQVITPLLALKQNGRAVVMAPLTLLLVLTVVSRDRTIRSPLVLPVFIGWLMFQEIIAVKNISLGFVNAGALFAVMFVVNFVIFCFGVTSWLRTYHDVIWAVRSVAIGLACFCACCAVQYAINPIALQAPWGRFEGMTGNPQHAAAYLALAIPSLLYLLRRTGEPLLFRMVWAGLLLAAALLLLWTGSRTGAVMTCVSVLVMFRRKLWVIVPCVTVTFLTMAFGGEEVDNTLVEQYGDRGDTRTANWLLMLNQFLAEPAFGRTDFENAINYKESSWLAMAAATGVIGLGALVFATYILARYLWFVAARPRPPHVRGLSDLVLATFLGLFVGSFFEAYLIGTITFPVYVTYLMFGVMNWVLEWRPAATPPQPAPPAPA